MKIITKNKKALFDYEIQEKLEAGLFWTIFNQLEEHDRHRMFTDWGNLFEKYVDFLLSSMALSAQERYVPFPHFGNSKADEESFDAVIVYGRTWIVVESKGGFLRSEAKYSEAVDVFLEDLERKFGRDKGAGIEQLSRKIGSVFARKDIDRKNIEGLEQNDINVVIPVMVVQDAYASSPLVSPWLAARFRDSMRKKDLRKRLQWLGLVVLDVGELEAIRPHVLAKEVTLSDCILERAKRGDPGLGKWPFTFRDIVEKLLDSKGINEIPRSDFNDKFDTLIERIAQRFFNRSFEKLSQDG